MVSKFVMNEYVRKSCVVDGKVLMADRGAGEFSSSFIVKANGNKKRLYGRLYLGFVYFPQEMVGKRIRLKVEVIE